MELRPYQEESVKSLRLAFASGLKSLILCIPTGGGKTVVFTTITKGAIKLGRKVMIVCDRKELIGQAEYNLNRLGLYPTIIAPGYKQDLNNCYLASVDTLVRRELPEVDIIIIDEAHKQTFDKIIKKYKEETPYNPLFIGATATPLRTGKQTSLHELYDKIIEPVTIDDLLKSGFLVPCITYAAKEDFSSVKITGNDYNSAALYEKFNKAKLYEGVVEKYKQFAEGKKALVFNVNVEHSKNMVKEFRRAGYKAEHLDGSTPKIRRKQILENFSKGVFNILSNCSVLTTGYDEPSIEAVIINRATKSLPLYLQMVGRGSRLYENKKNFICIDMGANVYEHGLWQEGRTWEIVKKRRNSNGVAPVKLCPSCEAMNYASARVCFDCGELFKIKAKALLKADFVEVTKGLKNVSRGATKLFNPLTASKEELKEHAKKQGYKANWVYVQLKRQQQKGRPQAVKRGQ
jgi:superfamily II DNA or RNA helicase